MSYIIFAYAVYLHKIRESNLIDLVGIGNTTHARHDTENIVIDSINTE